MKLQVIGKFNRNGDSGVYLEAIEVQSRYRYTAASYSLLPMGKRVRMRQVIELDIEAEELVSRLEDA